MFGKRTIDRQYKVISKYENDLLRKDHLLRESDALIRQAMQMQAVLEEINAALATENKRLAENADTDEDMMTEMFAEYKDMLKRYRRTQELEDENYRLWVENALLLGELAARDPEAALRISNRFSGG